MKQLLNFVLKQKLAIYLFTIIIMVFGIYSASKMNQESLPNVDIPYLIVTTVYPGATPEQINNEIGSPLEKRLQSIDRLNNIDSQSMNNFNLMILEFEYGTDLIVAKANLQKELDKLELDENVQEPSILEISMNSMPIASESITSKKYNAEELSQIIQKELVPKLEEIEGISEVTVNGLLEKEVQLTFDEEMLKKYNLTNQQLLEIVKANNVNMPIGIMDFENAKEAVTVVGEKVTLEEFENSLLPFPSENGFMKLKDFVTLEEVTIDNGISRVNGEDSLTLSIIKSQTGNTVNVVKDMHKIIDEFKDKYKDIKFVNISDQAEPIEVAVETMVSKALFGALAAIVIIMIFLRDVRSTVISLISIPLSLLMALAVLHQMEVTLNTMTLAAMTVAIGRVIDDSIVVVENIYRRLSLGKEEKLTGRALISASTIQMFIPILSSTLVTIAVFLPLMLVGGMIGEIFMPFALSMMFSLLASLLVAVTVVPALAHTFFKKELYDGKALKKHKESSKLNDLYEKSLKYSLNHKALTIILSIVLVGVSIFGFTKVNLGFLPSEVTNEWTITYTPANDELDKDIEKILTDVETLLLKEKDIKKVQATYSKSSDDMMSMFTGASASITASFDDVENVDKYKEDLLKKVTKLGGKGVWEDSMASTSSLNSNQVSYSVYGETLEDIEKAVKPLIKELSKIDNLKDVESDLNEVYKENLFVVDEEKLSTYGLTTAQVGMVLYNMSTDEVVTTVEKDGKEMKVVIKSKEQPSNNVDDLLNRVVGLNPQTNTPVFVKDVVKVEEDTTVNSITTKNGYLVATVTGTVTTDSVNKVNKDIDKVISEIDLPLGVSIDAGGVTEQMTDAFTQLGLAMLAAIAIVYLILVLTFREGLAPFVILFSLPMTIIGVVVALLVTNTTLDISGMLGLLMLIGIVVTNAIVLIDRVLENEYNGENVREALIDAGIVRLRPILMTAIATVGALIPLAIGAEGGGLISQGLGIVVIGGLFSSTILTLYIVPVLYELLSNLFKKDRKNIRQD